MKVLITLVCLAAAAGIGFFGVWEEYTSLRRNMGELETAQQDLRNMINYQEILEGTVTHLDEQYQDEVNKLEESVPEEAYVPSLFATVREIAQRTGVRLGPLTDYSLQEDSEDPRMGKIEFGVEIEGRLSAMNNFVTELENLSRPINVKEINMAREIIDARMLTYRLTLETYYYRE